MEPEIEAETKKSVSEVDEDSEGDQVAEDKTIPKKQVNMSPGAVLLRGWLNKTLRIKMSDGRVLIGVFLCTDRDANVILGSCTEYLPDDDAVDVDLCTSEAASNMEEPRMLGLAMVPGKHIVTIHIDQNESNESDIMRQPLMADADDSDIM